MLDDLDYVAEQPGERGELHDLREQLVAQIVNLSRRFTFKRNELIAAGSRPTWISRAEMEGRADYGKGYGEAKKAGLGSRLNRMRRQLAKKGSPNVGED